MIKKKIRLLNWSGKSVQKSLAKKNLSGFYNLKLGKIYVFKITALGAKNIGIDEFSYGNSILVPNTQIGDVVKAKIVKIYNKNYKYAIAQVVRKIKIRCALPCLTGKAQHMLVNKQENLTVENRAGTTSRINLANTVGNTHKESSGPLQSLAGAVSEEKAKQKNPTGTTHKVGDFIEVKISKIGPKNTGIAYLGKKKNDFLIIPQALKGQSYKVQITRIKKKYAFAKILTHTHKLSIGSNGINLSFKESQNPSTISNEIKEGSKIQLLLPVKLKRFLKYLVLKLNGSILFVKPNFYAKPGNLVQIKCVKKINLKSEQSSNSSLMETPRLVFGKIIKVQPMSAVKKRSLIKGSLRQMLQSGIHLGEKTVKCHARMKKYIWLRKKGPNKNQPLIQKKRHLINLFKTRRCLNKALIQLSKYALKGRHFLFVGTKKAAARLIARVSLFSKNSFFVNTRWLGGLLTNWKSILKSIKKISPILKQKQTFLKEIFQKRQNLKNNLVKQVICSLKRAEILKEKAKIIVLKFKNLAGSQVAFSDEANESVNLEIKKAFEDKIDKKAISLNLKREQFLTTGKLLLHNRQKLIQNNYGILMQSLVLKTRAEHVIKKKYIKLFISLIASRTKLREYGRSLIFCRKISQIHQLAKQKNEINTSWINEDLPKNLSDTTLFFVNCAKLIKSVEIENKKPATSESEMVQKSYMPSLRDKPHVSDLVLTHKQIADCLPFIEKYIICVMHMNNSLEKKLTSLKEELKLIKNKIQNYILLKTKFNLQLNKIKSMIVQEKPFLFLVVKKVKKLVHQQNFMTFLKEFASLKTPEIKEQIKEQIKQIVQYLLKNIVDPKLKYSLEFIYDEKVKNMSKKVGAARKKRWQRLEKYFGGIAKMAKMETNQVSKNVAIIIGQKHEMNAIRECQKLGIKMFQILDTNCNPTLADHFVPANDDSRNALEYLLKEFLTHIRLGQKLRSRLSLQN